MNFTSKKVSLFILAITALISSRAMFSFFNDPEGPNLLVVVVAGAIVYALSLVVYSWKPLAPTAVTRIIVTVFIQILIVAILYFCLR